MLIFHYPTTILSPQDGYWALGTTPEGCKPCKCDPGGAKSSTCDDVSGMCQCKQYLTGRQCNEVRPGFYVPNLDNNIFEAEDTSRSEGVSQNTTCIRHFDETNFNLYVKIDFYYAVKTFNLPKYIYFGI